MSTYCPYGVSDAVNGNANAFFMVCVLHRIKLLAVFDEAILTSLFYAAAYGRKTRRQLSTSPDKPFAFYHIIAMNRALFDQSGSRECACTDYTLYVFSSVVWEHFKMDSEKLMIIFQTNLFKLGHHRCSIYEPFVTQWLTKLCFLLLLLLFIIYLLFLTLCRTKDNVC